VETDKRNTEVYHLERMHVHVTLAAARVANAIGRSTVSNSRFNRSRHRLVRWSSRFERLCVIRESFPDDPGPGLPGPATVLSVETAEALRLRFAECI